MEPTIDDFIHVRVVEYNPEWPAMFEAEKRLLENLLGDNVVAIFHIGSTSVPGLAAKPIIDIMPVVRDIGRLDRCADAMAAIGYEWKGEFGIDGRRYFPKGGRERTHQIHAFQYDTTAHILRHLAFRNYLRDNAGLRDDYAALKRGLAAKFPRDIGAYCDGKDEFVKRGERDALAWQWRTMA